MLTAFMPTGPPPPPTQEKKALTIPRKLGNIGKIPKPGGDIAKRPVPLPQIKPRQQQLKIHAKVAIKLLLPRPTPRDPPTPADCRQIT